MAFTVAGLAAVALVFALAVQRGPWSEADAEAAIPVLVSLGALCVASLVRGRHPGLAWLAVITALAITTVDLAALARAEPPAADVTTWRWWSIAIVLAAIAGAGAAVAYASARRRRLGGWVPIVGASAMAILLGLGVVALAGPAPPGTLADPAAPLGALTLVTRPFLVIVVTFTLLGLLGDARPAARRANRRLAITSTRPTSLRAWPGFVAAWSRAFADEVAPGRDRAHRAAVAERSRLARDLHAEVVPAIRRALAEAERDESPERLAAALRDVLRDVDALAQSQHAVQLEVGGLVPALEWLAERTEDRSDVRVVIDVVDDAAAEAGAPPTGVVAAAYRIAGLALDNVVRHAPAASVTVAVEARRSRVRMAIADDGPGIVTADRTTATAAGRRGLTDMETEAAGCGATVTVQPVAGDDRALGSGTLVTFTWPAP